MEDKITCFRFLGAGLAACSLIGPGIGIGLVFNAVVIGTARNYLRRDDLFRYGMLGFALTEAVALLGLMIAFIILFK